MICGEGWRVEKDGNEKEKKSKKKIKKDQDEIEHLGVVPSPWPTCSITCLFCQRTP
jgi:hypothetical protein